MTSATMKPPRVLMAPRRWLLLVAVAATFSLLSLTQLSRLRSLRYRSASYTPTNPSPDCPTMDKYHRDPAFVAGADCLAQLQVLSVIKDLVLTLTALFESHNVTYFLDSGTLLGAFRDGRVIPYDSDADVVITHEGYQYITENKLHVPSDDYFLSVYGSEELYPGSQREEAIPVRFIHKPSALYVDVFVFKVRKARGSTTIMLGPEPSWAYSRCVECKLIRNKGMQLLVPPEWLFPTVNCAFEGVTLRCPRETELYLRYMFGAGFEIPIQFR